jgi:monoamine oxidase
MNFSDYWIDKPVPFLSPRFRQGVLRRAEESRQPLLLSELKGVLKRTTSKKVLVVGAGIGGAAIADLLRPLGFDVTVFDLRFRKGGRMKTRRDIDEYGVAESGAELIGSSHDLLLYFARRANVPLIKIRHQDYVGPWTPWIGNGGICEPRQMRAVNEEMAYTIPGLKRDSLLVNSEAPWKCPVTTYWDHFTVADWLKSLRLSSLCERAIACQVGVNGGISAHQFSAGGMLAHLAAHTFGDFNYFDDAENYRAAGGIQNIPERLIEGAYVNERFGLAVNRIGYDDNEVAVGCTNGDTFKGQYVVLATPPSTWSSVVFQPALPQSIMPSMGWFVKLLVKLDAEFEFEMGMNAMCILGKGLLPLIYEGSAGQRGKSGKVLNVFCGGETAQILSQMDGEEREEYCRWELEQVFPRITPHIRGLVFENWPAKRGTAAGISAPKVGDVTNLWPRLAEYHRRLFFCGEHAGAGMHGLMIGGALSAANTAWRILMHHYTTQ